jgi:hypothetical protein
MDMESILASRFSPLNFSAISGYPHLVPQIDEWQDLLPRFYEGENTNPLDHVLEFHALMQQLNIQHEDIHMKFFMYSVHGDALIWYHSLELSSVSSLEEFHATFNIHCQKIYSSKLICHSCCEEYKDCVQDITNSYEGCENEEYALEEESTLSLPCSSALDENCVCCLSKESAKIESVLEADILCNPVSKNPRYEQPILDSYDDDKILLPGFNLERKLVFNNEEKSSYIGQMIPLCMSFEAPHLFDHYGDSDEDVEVFFVLEEKIISSQPSNETEFFYQEHHDREKEPSIDIHEDISCHNLEDVIRKGKRELDQ